MARSSASAAAGPRMAATSCSEQDSVLRTFHWILVERVAKAGESSAQRAPPTASATPGKLKAQWNATSESTAEVVDGLASCVNSETRSLPTASDGSVQMNGPSA